ncbi:hypothetical protein I7I48_00694 [Histoplasma ohiense]|nr:hypothetical protein I7I48_00694 [Histoplasma ohiense (nom. inval.)]
MILYIFITPDHHLSTARGGDMISNIGRNQGGIATHINVMAVACTGKNLSIMTLKATRKSENKERNKRQKEEGKWTGEQGNRGGSSAYEPFSRGKKNTPFTTV